MMAAASGVSGCNRRDTREDHNINHREVERMKKVSIQDNFCGIKPGVGVIMSKAPDGSDMGKVDSLMRESMGIFPQHPVGSLIFTGVAKILPDVVLRVCEVVDDYGEVFKKLFGVEMDENNERTYDYYDGVASDDDTDPDSIILKNRKVLDELGFKDSIIDITLDVENAVEDISTSSILSAIHVICQRPDTARRIARGWRDIWEADQLRKLENE